MGKKKKKAPTKSRKRRGKNFEINENKKLNQRFFLHHWSTVSIRLMLSLSSSDKRHI